MRSTLILVIFLLAGCYSPSTDRRVLVPPPPPGFIADPHISGNGDMALASIPSPKAFTAPTGLAFTGISSTGAVVTLTWINDGDEIGLQRATSLSGPWETVDTRAVSPYSLLMQDRGFFRLVKPPVTPVEFVYTQDFISRTKPPEWTEWVTHENHVQTWAYPVPITGYPAVSFADDGALAVGAFCSFAGGESFNEVWLTFRFRVESAAVQVIEVCDLYDNTGPVIGQEVCNIYIYPDGMLHLYMASYPAWCEAPVPVGEAIKIRLHYRTDGIETIGELWWAYADEDFGNELQSCATLGYFKTPIRRFLWGPLHSGGHYAYANVKLTTVAP